MSGASALKKIAARARALKKKHPNAKYKTLQKKAGAEYRAGKLKTKRKPAKAKAKKARRKRVGSSGNTRTATKASTSRNRTATSTKTIRANIKVGSRKRKKRYTPKRKQTRRRVSGAGSSSMLLPLAALAALGVGAYLLLKPATPPAQQWNQTANPARAQAQNNILAYATAGGLALSAITDLIKALNQKSDAEVIAAGQSEQAFNNAFTDVFGYY